eukprot:9476146-Pyramimonas_sp.AAC.1
MELGRRGAWGRTDDDALRTRVRSGHSTGRHVVRGRGQFIAAGQHWPLAAPIAPERGAAAQDFWGAPRRSRRRHQAARPRRHWAAR